MEKWKGVVCNVCSLDIQSCSSACRAAWDSEPRNTRWNQRFTRSCLPRRTDTEPTGLVLFSTRSAEIARYARLCKLCKRCTSQNWAAGKTVHHQRESSFRCLFSFAWVPPWCGWAFCYVKDNVISRLHLFMRIHIFMNTIRETRYKNILSSKEYNEYSNLNTLYSFCTSYSFCVFQYLQISYQCIKICSLAINLDHSIVNRLIFFVSYKMVQK